MRDFSSELMQAFEQLLALLCGSHNAVLSTAENLKKCMACLAAAYGNSKHALGAQQPLHVAPSLRRYRRLDAGSLVLWAIAVATVVSAALWAGNDYTREALAARAGGGTEVLANITHALSCGVRGIGCSCAFVW